ncbi:hypothetical protein [Microbacterium invictum]|uniref:Leucyl-tRNA synthetase n=1 Tax=Microbacterium invictum TaxID=515415 RepID=A0ABZ0VH26_9MICO|nr:hypothetical protein [Microbacterium invictum]WQB71505.1 hypothetical protein T9R20_05985 [Microbacterium invictum]
MTTSADTAVNAVLEIFSWVGLGLGGLVLVVAGILALADGTWEPVTAMIDDDDEQGGRVARWFGSDGEVGEARLTHDQLHALAGQDSAPVFARRDDPGRMRLTKGSPTVRFVAWFGVGLVGLGMVTLVISWILLFAGG